MLAPVKHVLDKCRVVLASGSPRRQELVSQVGLNVELCPSEFEENLNPSDFKDFPGFVEETAYQKALEVWNRIRNPNIDKKPTVVIAADTIVELNGKVYGKPGTAKNAVQMLTELSGRSHYVFTGVVVKYDEGVVRFTETTKVFFANISLEQIKAYVNTGEPLDKAGAYGIQQMGGSMVERIEGDFYNVMGLPLYRLCSQLCKIFSGSCNNTCNP